jgi:hypothetical protein
MQRTAFTAMVLVVSALSLSARAEQDCSAIDDPEARLACYDEQFSRASGAEDDESSEAVAQPQEAVPATPPAAEQAPSAPAAVITSEPVTAEPEEPQKPQTAASEGQEPGKGGLFDQDELVDLTSTITHVHARAQQKMVFQLENKQVWMQSVPRLLRIREGDQVTIENASVGGYMMRTDRGVTTRVERIR